jgi:hypothetical protein
MIHPPVGGESRVKGAVFVRAITFVYRNLELEDNSIILMILAESISSGEADL